MRMGGFWGGGREAVLFEGVLVDIVPTYRVRTLCNLWGISLYPVFISLH